MLVVAPDGVVQIVAFPYYPERFVCVVPIDLFVVLAFSEREAPVFDVDVLVSGYFGVV